MSEIKLKPCPFCGGEVRLMAYPECDEGQACCINCEEELDAGYAFIHCYNCDTDFFPHSDIAREVLEAWNRRDGAE